MKRRLLTGLLSVLLVSVAIYGCGEVVKTEGATGVAGYLFAANGVLPIAGATVQALEPSSSTVIAETTTDTNGYFKLEIEIVVGDTRVVDVSITKGSFTASYEQVNVRQGRLTHLGDGGGSEDIILNGDNPNVKIAKMAVVTGDFDHMEDVLAKLGYGTLDVDGVLVLGTEQFDIYDGNDLILYDAYPNFDVLVTSPEAMNQYDIIFINCGNAYEYLLSDPAVINNIKNYVIAGGSLYVTDLSYDFVEQVFPEYIDFYGDDTIQNDAEVGDGYIVVNGEALDTTLKNWLGGPNINALNPDGTIRIEGFLPGWAVMDSAGSNTTVWVRGNVSYNFGANSGVKPLTVFFNYGVDGGKILYSSYHTEEEEAPTLRPQEYILAHLIFEM